MKFDHKVKYNGKWYMPGEEITEVEKSTSDFSKYMNLPEDELPFVDVPHRKTYTKTEINRMSTAELRDFAIGNGISNANDMTGAELKKVLIANMGL